MASNQIQFRPDDKLMAFLEARAGRPFAPSPGLAAEKALEYYVLILERSRPAFAENEAMLIADALNGIILEPQTVQLLWANVDDAIQMDHLDQKWHVDGAALVARLRALSYAEVVALADAVSLAWNAPEYHIANMEERLRKVGLVHER